MLYLQKRGLLSHQRMLGLTLFVEAVFVFANVDLLNAHLKALLLLSHQVEAVAYLFLLLVDDGIMLLLLQLAHRNDLLYFLGNRFILILLGR